MRVASPKLDCPFVRSLVVVQDGTVITSVVLQIAAVDPSLTGSWAVQFFQWYPVTSSSGKSPPPIRQRMLEASGIMRGGVGEDMALIPHLTLFFFFFLHPRHHSSYWRHFFPPFSVFFFLFF